MYKIVNICSITSFTIQSVSQLMKETDKQLEQIPQNKIAVILSILLNSIPSVNVTNQVKLLFQSGICFIYTLDHKFLYIGKVDNLRICQNIYYKYQYFIEPFIYFSIGYFTFESIDNLNQNIDEFQPEPIKTIQSKVLVISHQFEKPKSKLINLKKQLNDTLSVLVKFGFR